ncbi:MAG: tetratricopeptide repeat protein [Candidatus Marinimicrobia bacterium]|nr:tetratricopeptide repeat protein [Candidatus Neomarinimicrobiota bacterium]
MIKKQSIFLVIVLSVIFPQDRGQSHYDKKEFDKAQSYYENILLKRENDLSAHFGLGASAYQQKDIERAVESFNQVMESDNQELQSKALFNMGNILHDQQKLEEALAFYRKSLELNTKDEDARYNYETVKQMLQQQQQQQQQNKDQDKDKKEEKNDKEQNQDSQNQENENQENKDQSKKDQNNKQEEQNQNSEEKQDQKDQEQSKQNESEEQKEQEKQSSETGENKEGQPKSDDRVQAEAILNALKDKEQINQKRQISRAKTRKLEKDW